MIISASRRTDIPAFFSDWFYQRVKEGYVVNQNPFNAKQLSKIRLDSDVVDAIVLWTKNATPFYSRLSELDERGLFYYFQYTVTPYGADFEPNLHNNKTEIIESFKAISSQIGPERVLWRYDPIFFSDKYSMYYHERAFDRCASLLEGATERVVISFLDMDYNNTKAINKLGIRDGSPEEKNEIAGIITGIAKNHGLVVETCAEEIDLSQHGIQHGCCIDANLIERLTGRKLNSTGHSKDKNQRPLCGCVSSVDIGTYNTCSHRCQYCYANFSASAIEANLRKHDKTSALLLGECDADSVPWRKNQQSLFMADKDDCQQLSIENL